MPTKKTTSFVCLMLTAAMLWSSLGVGLISTPAEETTEAFVLEDGTANMDITPEVSALDVNGPSVNKDDVNVNMNGDENNVNNFGGWNYEPSAMPLTWNFRDAHNVPEVEQMGYTGDGVRVAVADTGIDFGAQNLAGKYMVDNTTYSVTNVSLASSTVLGQDNVSMPNSNIVSGSLEIRVNGTVTTNYTTPNWVRGEVNFTKALPLGSSVVCSYNYTPYKDWPIAFDALGLPQYLLAKEARTGGGGVANTTLNGTGPFDINHVVKVDGKNDFTITERACPDDSAKDIKTTGTATGLEFDLTELWGTRDTQFWYAGVKTSYANMNLTFGFAMDFDGAASGSINDPHGNLLDFEASHSAPVDQVAYDSNHGWLASCAGGNPQVAPDITKSYEYNSVKIWDINGNLLQTLPTEQYRVDSVTWSRTGDKLAYSTGLETVVYHTSNWTEQWRMPHSVSSKLSYYREALAFSPDGTTLITGAIVASNRIFVLNVTDGSFFSPLCPLDTTETVAYNPTGTLVALGLANGMVQIVDSTDFSNTVMVLETYILKEFDVKDQKPVETIAWSPDGMHLAVGRTGAGYINIWNLSGNMTWGDNNFNLTGHMTGKTVNTILWNSANSMISGCDDGTVRYWNPFTSILPVTTRNSKDNSPVLSLTNSTNHIFVATKDCTVRKYPSDWSSYVAFASHKPDIMVYIRHNKENYSADGEKLADLDYIEDPDVYRWNTTTFNWDHATMSSIFGGSFYKGSQGGEWVEKGFLEIALPRNYTAWPNQNTMYITSFTCGDNSSRPQDTVPSDANVPSPGIPTYVNWTGTKKTTLSAWGRIIIPKTTIVPADIPSATGNYHFGYHPSAALTNMYGLVPLVVTESTSPGIWDRVYVDMNLDYVIDAKDPYVDRNNPILTIDIWNYSFNSTSGFWDTKLGSDGVADVSGGMLYFIGDGKTKMPYSDRMSEVLMASGDQRTPFNSENPMPIPKNGEIIAFYGEFDLDSDLEMLTHGTQTASAIAGEGLNQGLFAPVKGVSPDVKFLPICNAQYGLNYALYFAVEGYDGKPNTGDEAQIVSVGQYIPGYGNGFDEISNLVEYLVNLTKSSAVFISPAGNDGSGYGTIAAPCSLNTLVVGFAEDNYFISSGGNTQHFGDVSELSSRGPTAAGLAKPDVIAIGLGEVDLPLGSTGNLISSVGGKNQVSTWKGSDLAAAVTTGTMALVFEAYYNSNHQINNRILSKTSAAVASGAKFYLGHAPLVSGTSVLRINDTVVATSEYTLWTNNGTVMLNRALPAGAWFNASYSYNQEYPTTNVAMDIIRSSAKDLGHDPLTQGAGFVDALAAVKTAKGDSGLIVSAPKTSFGNSFGVEYGSFINVLGQGENDTIPFNVQNPMTSTESPIYEIEYMQRMNISTSYPLVDKSNGYIADISSMFPIDAEVIKVTAQTNYSWYNPIYNLTNSSRIDDWEYKSFLGVDGSFYMKLWDWVDAQPFGDPEHGIIDSSDDMSYLTGVEHGDLNSMICTLSNPQGNLAGNLVLEITPTTTSGLPTKQWKITIESFAAVPWSWSSLSKTTSDITGYSEDNVNVKVDVPSNAQPGTYGAAFVASYDPTPVSWTDALTPSLRPEEEYLNTTLQTTFWDDGYPTGGNYWSNHVGTGNISDGIYDNPYTFLTPGKMDNYPLVSPAETYSDIRTIASPISIASNADFEDYATMGDGSAGNPWLIENIKIQSPASNGIEIMNTDDYFIIRNCEINNSVLSGISLSGVENGEILDCEIYSNTGNGIQIWDSCLNILVENSQFYDNSGNGIHIKLSTNIKVNNNQISANFDGLFIDTSDYVTTTENDVFSNFEVGIYLTDCNNNIISSNHIHDEVEGLWLFMNVATANDNQILWNTFENFTPDWADPLGRGYANYIAIMMASTVNTVINGNNFINCNGSANAYVIGDITNWDGNHWEEYTDVDTTPADGIWDNPFTAIDTDWNGFADLTDNAPLVNASAVNSSYHTPSAPIIIASDADFTTSPGVINPGAAGTADDPFIIEGWDIDTTGFGYGIRIENTNASFAIMNCLVYGNITGNGIEIYNASNGAVRSNRLHTLADGVLVENTPAFFVAYNHIQIAGIGLQLWNSNSSIAMVNTVTGGTQGIYIWGSNLCMLSLNEINGASKSGINATASDWTLIENNRISGNAKNGILLQWSDNCTITLNTLSSNGYGIHLANATGFNWIYHNNLLSNTVQAYDDFIGDILASTFELFSKFGIPANYVSTYDVISCTITRDGVPLTSGYIVNNDTGLVTFTATQTGRSGGAIISVKAVLNYEENASTIVKLPNTRLTDGTVTVSISVTKKDGSVQIISPTFDLYRKVGIIVLDSTFKIERGATITVDYTYYNRTGIMPLTLNVLTAESGNFKFGNLSADENALGTSIMPTWGVRAGQGASLISGDRRYFYVRVPNQGMFSVTELANFYLYSELAWALNETDINIVVYGKGATAMYTNAAPYVLTKLGASEEKTDFSFLTATNGPKDILVTSFTHEILTICVSAKSFNGTNNATSCFQGESGWLKMSDNNPKAWTNDVVGHTSISFQSSVEISGVTASIVGPAQGTKSLEEIYQDDLSLYDLSTMEGWLTMNAVAGFTKVVTVKNALSWDVHIMGHPECVDLDLALFYDGKAGNPKDGIAQWQEVITNKDMQFDAYKDNYGTGSTAGSADADADEAVKIISPWDGDYIIKVLGYTVTTQPGYFDLEIKSILAGVEGYKMTHVDTEYEDGDPSDECYLNNDSVAGFETRTFNILWSFPEGTEDNVYGGIFVLGIPESPKLIVIAMDIILDREAPVLLPGFTGPNTIVSDNRPTISAKIEDLIKGEIDPDGATVSLDGEDITNIASISIMNTKNTAEVPGFWTGDIIYKSLSPLSEGGHFMSIEVKDKTGNANIMSWGFTVDTTKPEMLLSNSLDEIYTSTENYQLSGTTEPNSIVSIIGVKGVVNQRIDNSFQLNLDLEEGANLVAIRSTDAAGNTYETIKSITLDTEAPEFKRVVALDGSTTNRRTTGIYGEMTEAGTLELNNVQVPVNSDGTFRNDAIMLVEGQNRQVLKFTDLAGNVAYSYMNITLDSVAPMLLLADIDKTVNSEWLNITGKTESAVASLTINGKLVDVTASGNFQNNIRLSPGINTIVIESKDRAGNSAQEVMTVVYAAEAGTNFAAIGLMVALLVVGLILGLFLAPIILGGKKEEMPEEAVTPLEGVEETDIPAEGEEIEAIPEEAAPNTESSEPIEETKPEIAPESGELEVAPESVNEVNPETEELESIPVEESMPDELPEEVVSPEEAQPEIVAEAEDPRVVKLKEAYESGKISKELYEKNLARFKGN